jgi:hypothetical protein
MPSTCFSYPADVPPSLCEPRTMPIGGCFSYPGEVARTMPLTCCFSYSVNASPGRRNAIQHSHLCQSARRCQAAPVSLLTGGFEYPGWTSGACAPNVFQLPPCTPSLPGLPEDAAYLLQLSRDVPPTPDRDARGK